MFNMCVFSLPPTHEVITNHNDLLVLTRGITGPSKQSEQVHAKCLPTLPNEPAVVFFLCMKEGGHTICCVAAVDKSIDAGHAGTQ